MYVDTNVFIDLIRGKKNSLNFFKNYTGTLKTSVIVKLELIDGLHAKRDISFLNKKTFDFFQIEIVQINEDISINAEEIYKSFRHSHGISINDSIIAATALYLGEPLATHNTKHFNFIKNLNILTPY